MAERTGRHDGAGGDLFRDGKRAEAYELADAMLDAPDPLFDPWREYVHADDRFWPLLIGKLRAGIVPMSAWPRAVAACLVLASLAVLSAQTPPTTPPQQTFRTATDAVIVDAAVRAGGKMVPELAAADFVLTDNNVRQTIDSVENTSVPIDLTLVVDVSGNPRRPWAGFIDKKKMAHAITAEVLQVTNLLRPTDRVRVLAIDRYVRQVFGFTPVSAFRSVTGPPMRLVEVDGLGSVYDTLAAALIHDVEPWRRHVVIARTKGRDSISGVSAEAVGAIAERSEALFHLVVMETAMDNEVERRGFQADAIKAWGSPGQRTDSGSRSGASSCESG